MKGLKPTLAAAAALLALGTAAVAQAPAPTQAPVQAGERGWPSQLVRIVVPFSAGSITDNLARILADKLSELWKQQVIVENRPGLPGTTSAAKAPPDGYTLMLTSNGHTVAGTVNKNIQFDPVKDFVGVSKVASVPLVAIVPPDLAVRSLADFVALAKDKPGKLNFSSAGVASSSFLGSELMKQGAAIDIVHVPYKGVPEAVTAVIRNDAQLYFAPIPNAQELATSGKVRMIAVNSNSRSAKLPDLPTVKETVPSYDYDSWFAVLAPVGTPGAVVSKVNADIARVLKMPDAIEKLDALGAVPSPGTPQALDAQLARETEFYAKVLRDAGVGIN
ncbi:MAG: tripartite tricarboxylate transporter substrate binding protein [Rhodovulum sp.]|nr:tripartite tricarboxylate transporter substrate binding protein [Rhodovulum sp.]